MSYKFRKTELLEKALTHPSYSHERLKDKRFNYERLEFLGDSIVNFLLAHWVYENFPMMDEGKLSKLKAALSSKEVLARASRRMGLHEMVRLSKGEERSGGREKDSILSDVFEAYVAAVFLDGGIEEAKKVVMEALAPELEKVLEEGGVTFDYKSALQEFLQGRGEELPVYTVVKEEGPPHRRKFTVAVEVGGRKFYGEGASKKEAMYSAAKAAWEVLVGKEDEIIKDKFFLPSHREDKEEK